MSTYRGGPRPALTDASTKALFDYWNALRNGRPVPQRREVDPVALRAILSRIFVLEVVDPHHVIFRIAGTALCAAFGREFRDHNFIDVWNRESRVEITEMLRRIADHAEAALMSGEAATLDKTSVKCELLVLPLGDANGDITRMIGVAGCAETLARLGWRRLVRLTAKRLIAFDPSETAVAFRGEESIRPPLTLVRQPDQVRRSPETASQANPRRDHLRTLLQIDE